MIKYRIDVLQTLKEHGYSSARLRKDKLIGERNIQQLRHYELVSWAVMNKICKLTGLNVGDIVTYSEE